MQIVDIHELSRVLNTNVKTLAKRWRGFPHFFTGTGRNLKSARFDLDDVLRYLKHDCVARSQNGKISKPVQAAKQNPRQEGFRNQKGGPRLPKERAMIKDPAFFERWEKDFNRSETLDLERKLRLYQAMHEEARALGVLPGTDRCEGLDTKIRLARAIHVQATAGKVGPGA
jgi:hypothetical protein